MSEQDRKVKLVVHIGAGKTGSTSIQHTLRDNSALFQQRGVWYLGLTGERAPLKQCYPWQTVMGYHELMGLDAPRIEQEFADFLIRNLHEIQFRGGAMAILSNESLEGYARYDRIQPILAALRRVQADGWSIEVICYVRRPDSWIKSAYIQWGIKHKTYSGPLKSFKEWASTYPYKQAPSLTQWSSLEGIPMHTRNFDKAGDVVLDFLKVCGISPDGLRLASGENVQPSTEELLLRALMNRVEQGQVLPDEFEEVIRPYLGDFRASAQSLLDELLPTEEEIADHLASCTGDVEIVNRMIVSDGGEPLDINPRPFKKERIDGGKLDAALFYLSVAQARKIREQEKQIGELSQRIATNHEASQLVFSRVESQMTELKLVIRRLEGKQ